MASVNRAMAAETQKNWIGMKRNVGAKKWLSCGERQKNLRVVEMQQKLVFRCEWLATHLTELRRV
jgi:hypothetical protein